jgi:hypothetical protein
MKRRHKDTYRSNLASEKGLIFSRYIVLLTLLDCTHVISSFSVAAGYSSTWQTTGKVCATLKNKLNNMNCFDGVTRRMSTNEDNIDDSRISNIVTTFDRFRSTCPASIEAIRLYDPALIPDDDQDEDDCTTWVAVFRSNNNRPGVFLRDELFQSMMTSVTNAVMPTTVPTTTMYNVDMLLQTPALEFKIKDSDESIANNLETGVGLKLVKPVAVARLRRRYQGADKESPYYYLLDSMRCVLKKESMDSSCDGGSEHTEAIATAVDTLMRHYLSSEVTNIKSISTMPILEGAIRAKATLVSAPILEQRGFVEITSLCPDMATHVSSYDDCFQFYAHISVVSTISSPSTRQRSIAIVSLLGRLDRATEFAAAVAREKQLQINNTSTRATDDRDYDPWANMKKFL